MSSSHIVEPQEGKKDDTLILMVNDNGVISVDQDTLQSLIINQSNATVSVVRLGQTDSDAAEGNITLTVDPPPIMSTEVSAINTPDPTTLDPFMEMDAEQLERLETALQSEEAKQILGENVTAMLDMLTVEEQQNSIRYSIELDHSYTSRFSSSQSKPTDSLSDITAFDMDGSMCIDFNKSTIHTPILLPVSSTNINTSITPIKQKVTSVPPKIVKQPISIGGRTRRTSNVMQPITSTPKSIIHANLRTISNSMQQENKLYIKVDDPIEGNELLSTSESSASEESDSDSDFGPRPSRRGVRARGGRRGLTTRGGSIATSRRRGSNKQMDSEQVRRLDLEMAAAVSAMKSPEKEEKSEKNSLGKCKKQLKTVGIKKKDELFISSIHVNETPTIETNVLQTTNQVKANLINANMFKGDMILTKPGQDRNQKVVFVQKQFAMNPNDNKISDIKKQITVQKNKLITSQNLKVPITKDIKVSSTSVLKGTSTIQQSTTVHANLIAMGMQTESFQNSVQTHKTISPVIDKTKFIDTKKEKKKIDIIPETSIKLVVEPSKSVEIKLPTAQKKIYKKEHRKSDTLVVEALGPALFSTPDIIRRVGSTCEAKVTESSIAMISVPSSSIINNSSTSNLVVSTATNISTTSYPTVNATISSRSVINVLNESMNVNTSTNNSVNEAITTKLDLNASILSETLEDIKIDNKTAMEKLLQPVLNTASNSIPSKEISPVIEQTNNLKHVISQSIENDDHLLATLEMEAAKQLPNDEELLAEALLLQETLGVDLDQSGLVDPTPEIPESILSSSIMEPTSPVMNSLIKRESASVVTCKTTEEFKQKSESMTKKDIKNPIQIVRGGRVITLPPIEAPATRSKRLQAKTENQQVKTEKIQQKQLKVEPLIIKTERTSRIISHVSLQKQDMIYDMEDDEEDEEADTEANSDSEDDPNRLWCICKQPHNNRFMICCDICQDWFHGKCVHVTKAMGEQMENQGIEWVCPNCLKKKNEESKSKSRRTRNIVDIKPNETNKNLSVSNVPINDIKVVSNSGKTSVPTAGVTHCVVCKKEARKSSIYCSDACILAHAEVTSVKDKPSFLPQPRTSKTNTVPPKLKSDVRIIVFDKKTGKVLTGEDAPTAINLKVWLKEHPSFEVVKSNNLNAIQLGGKTITTITQEFNTNKLLQGKVQNQAKMVYSKVVNSKQAILSANTKKTVLLTDIPSSHTTIALPLSRSKQLTLSAEKTPTSHIKQASNKTAFQQQQQQTSQKSGMASTLKLTHKKSQEVKTSIFQYKQLQQQQQQQQQQLIIKNFPVKKPETEPIRLNVRKTLTELLSTRIKEANDLNIKEEEIVELALQIELEMYKFFKEAGAKYKAKYRSLVFNIKDTKNLTLFRKIADHSLRPEAVVKLSPEEMASQELAEWREKENKHQLEMIKKNELDLMAQAKSIVVKTHKGEQIIENDGSIERVDPKTPVQDIVTALNSGESISSTVEGSNQKEDKLTEELKKSKILEEDKKKKQKERDKEKRHGRSRDREKRRDRSISKSRHRHSKDRDKSKEKKLKRDVKHKERIRDKNKERDKSRDGDKKIEKDKDKKDKYKQTRSSSRSHSKSRHKDHKEKYKKDEEKKKEIAKNDTSTTNVEKAIEERLWRHIEDETTTNTLDGNDSDISDREPSSTVTIKTPDINEELDKEILESSPNTGINASATVWRGFVYMADVAKFFVTAQNVSGNSKDLMEDLPDTFDVVGRINPFTVWDYIGKMKKNATKEILIIKLTATNDEEKIPYITLYSYLNSRNRLGVLGNISPNIKDFYIMPFSNGSKLPSVLLPLDAPDLEENRQHLLLGIIVVQRKKRPANVCAPLCPVLSKISKKEQPQLIDRSYTPPTLSSQLLAEDESITPPNSPRSNTHIKVLSHEVKQDFSVISKIVPELSSKITLETSSLSNKMQLDDDDKPYSPGEPVDVTIDDNEHTLSPASNLKIVQTVSEATSTAVSPVKSSTELQRKMEELSRQIEEEKQQIQNISSSFLGDSSATLPGLGLDPPDNNNAIEAYSPSDTRSFTPPPQGIPKLTQPILDKVSKITIPPNLQEILANVKRQENSKVDPYLPSKPSATFLTTVNSATYQSPQKYSPAYNKTLNTNRLNLETQSSRKESKTTLSSLSDYDIMKKAEEELAALAAASIISNTSISTVMPQIDSPICSESPPSGTSFQIPHR